ncbi:hypothetical protein RFI_20927 [Reticulomyxa filosa]|uniref:TRAF-type domain-containing protein n=1 Tax=Reticulomyxa filosa TaxID=46433 RepID=X6MTJ6_RETFI|nr:hypothetical protein RFI_20927 [Reticulomyxa filosa]|eukprot:ETO16415.1 hypothetical protein RFI_20927 [Reticulomyxa filosa]
MLALNAKEEEKKIEIKKEVFLVCGCFNKDWISLTNEQQKFDTLICCLCNRIANSAMELQCDEHENAEHVYLVGEECLQTYLKQNNGKCPIGQHEHCDFSKNKMARQQVSDLLVICPRQYDLNIYLQSNGGRKSGEKEEYGKCNCNYKGKIKEMKDHLNNSCNLMPIQQNNLLNIQSELGAMRQQIRQLKENDDEQKRQIQQLNVITFFFKKKKKKFNFNFLSG